MDWRVEELTLPSEIWNLILKHLGTRDILRASIVNKISHACRLFVHTVQLNPGHSLHFGKRLASLPNITNIEISHVGDTDEFEKLTVLQKLQDLTLSGPTIRPVLYNVLEKITSLRTLNMTYFPRNFNLIANSCTQLTQLILRTARNDKIDEITAIQQLTKLRKLKLTIARNIPFVDLAGLTQLTNVTYLVLSGPNFNVNLSRGDFNALINLKILKLRQMSGKIGHGIQKLTNLEQLRVFQIIDPQSNSLFESCLPLVNLTSLEVDSLTFRGHYLRMTELTNLKALRIDISPNLLDHLTKMTALKNLSLAGPLPVEFFVSDLFLQMTQLENLHIWTWKNQNVQDEELRSLSNLDRLTSLSLYSLDCITSAGISHAISRLTNLKYLDVSGKLLKVSEMFDVIKMPSLSVAKINGALEKGDCK